MATTNFLLRTNAHLTGEDLVTHATDPLTRELRAVLDDESPRVLIDQAVEPITLRVEDVPDRDRERAMDVLRAFVRHNPEWQIAGA